MTRTFVQSANIFSKLQDHIHKPVVRWGRDVVEHNFWKKVAVEDDYHSVPAAARFPPLPCFFTPPSKNLAGGHIHTLS